MAKSCYATKAGNESSNIREKSCILALKGQRVITVVDADGYVMEDSTLQDFIHESNVGTKAGRKLLGIWPSIDRLRHMIIETHCALAQDGFLIRIREARGSHNLGNLVMAIRGANNPAELART